VNPYWTFGDEEVVAQRLDTGTRKILLRDAADARYVPTGHLVFLRRGALFAVPFDAERLETRGAEVLLLDGVAQSLVAGFSADVTAAGQVAVSSNGTLAWVAAPVPTYPDSTLVTVDRRGHLTPLPAPVRAYGPMLRVSPDGRTLAVCIKTLTETGLWLYDLTRGTLTPRNRDGQSDWPVWSPDGQQLTFQWLKEGRLSLAIQRADGTAPPRRFAPGNLLPTSWTPDGGHLMAVQWDDPRRDAASQPDIVRITSPERGVSSVETFIETAHFEGWPELSPDGRWLAYASNLSGRIEVYLRPYPGPGASEPVSTEGGANPIWNPNGKKLFFMIPPDRLQRRRMMAVDFVPGSPPRLGRPRPLFTITDEFMVCTPVRCHDVAPDGRHFYAVKTPPPPAPPAVTHIHLIQNWFEELKARAPGR
jgi:serine/threonine-protein kinase